MKLFKNLKSLYQPKSVLWIFPLQLIVPNVILSFTEGMPWIAAIANVLLPLGIYYILISLSVKTGRSILLFLPVIFFAAFQIVLLSLYGQSIIGVDMFLNMVTTNSGEVAELLDSLIVPMIIVALLYLSPLIWAIIAIIKKWRAPRPALRHVCVAGEIMAMCGIITTIISYISVPYYGVSADMFPVNVAYNVGTAVRRTIRTNNYMESSKDFAYHAKSTHDPSQKEIYVMVIGETGRANNWQLLGYDRATTPRLCSIDSLIGFNRALTESNTTHKSVPMLMSTFASENYDSIYSRKCIISAFKEAGFLTAFLSMQRYNHSFIDFFGMEADTTDFIRERSPKNAILYDGELLDATRHFIESTDQPKLFIVLHTYGSHFNYRDRYPEAYSHFIPDKVPDASPKYRSGLVNAYDNTILYTDHLLGEITSYLDSLSDRECAIIYASDHGEDIFDYGNRRFLHASPVPTYHQLHVPMLLWMSGTYRSRYPEKWDSANAHRNLNVSTSASVANTLLDIAGITTPYTDLTKSLTYPSYTEPERIYLNDRNEAIPLQRAGMTDVDIELLEVNKLISPPTQAITQSFPKNFPIH